MPGGYPEQRCGADRTEKLGKIITGGRFPDEALRNTRDFDPRRRIVTAQPESAARFSLTIGTMTLNNTVRYPLAMG